MWSLASFRHFRLTTTWIKLWTQPTDMRWTSTRSSQSQTASKAAYLAKCWTVSIKLNRNKTPIKKAVTYSDFSAGRHRYSSAFYLFQCILLLILPVEIKREKGINVTRWHRFFFFLPVAFSTSTLRTRTPALAFLILLIKAGGVFGRKRRTAEGMKKPARVRLPQRNPCH